MDSILRGKSFNIQMRGNISDNVTCSSIRHYHDPVSTLSSTPSEEPLLVDNLACMNNQNAKKREVESSSVRCRVTEKGEMYDLSLTPGKEYLRTETYTCCLCNARCHTLKVLYSHAMGRRYESNYQKSLRKKEQNN
jgi:hypothetical protein